MQNNTYTTDISSAAGLGLGRTTSLEGKYNMKVAARAAGIANCYTVTATTAGSQANDTNCTTITLFSTGIKSGINTTDCW